MLRSHINHCLYGHRHGRVLCLQRGTIHRRQWQLWKAHEDVEEMVTAIVRIGEYVRTMGRVVSAEVIAMAVGSLETVNRVDW